MIALKKIFMMFGNNRNNQLFKKMNLVQLMNNINKKEN